VNPPEGRRGSIGAARPAFNTLIGPAGSPQPRKRRYRFFFELMWLAYCYYEA
jgi:hypothetical protein